MPNVEPGTELAEIYMFFAVIKLPFQWGRQTTPKTALFIQSKCILKCYVRKAVRVHNRVTLPSHVRLS